VPTLIEVEDPDGGTPHLHPVGRAKPCCAILLRGLNVGGAASASGASRHWLPALSNLEKVTADSGLRQA